MESKERCYWISAGRGKKIWATEQVIAMVAQEVKIFLADIDSKVRVVIDDWKVDSTTQKKTAGRLRVLADILSDSVVDGSVRLCAHGLNMEAERLTTCG